MNSIETQALFDLGHTLAAPLLAQVRFPWEALKQIKDFIQTLGEGLDPAQYEERAPGVWVARDAKVFDSAYLGGPGDYRHEAEVRQCAILSGQSL